MVFWTRVALHVTRCNHFEEPEMKISKNHIRLFIAAAFALALIAASGLAGAQVAGSRPGGAPGVVVADAHEVAAIKHVTDAAVVAQRMLQEPRMKELLQQAKGIFIVPSYGRAALGVGASGGAGVLVVRRADGGWSDPLFYNIGGISAGAQIGAESGAIAMVLINEKAVNQFMQKNAFSLNAESGLTIVNWTKVAQGSVGAGDVAVWAGTKGLYGNLVAVGVSDIRYNETLTSHFYHATVTPAEVIAGKYTNPHADILRQALAAASGTPPAVR
jgi:lipid-binding SYLF domain-containing protein